MTHQASPSSSDPDERFLDEVLDQLVAGQFTAAARLAARHRQHPYRGVGAGSDARWPLVHELVATAGWLPDPLVQALARGVRADDLAAELPAIGRFASTDPRAAEASARLRHRAPRLFQVVGRALPVPAEPAPPPPPMPSVSRAPYYLIALVIAGLRAACLLDRGPAEPAPAPSYPYDGR